jgi:hypothetical protein
MGTNDPNYYDATTGRLLDLDVLRGLFDEHVDASHDPVESMGMTIKASWFMRNADRPAYDQAFNDWADAEVKDGRLSVGPPIVDWDVTLDMGTMTAGSAIEAARKTAASLAGNAGAGDGYAWRAVYDVVGPDSTEHTVDLEIVGSGRTCIACGHVDEEDEHGERHVSDEGVCRVVLTDGHVCGGRMWWQP